MNDALLRIALLMCLTTLVVSCDSGNTTYSYTSMDEFPDDVPLVSGVVEYLRERGHLSCQDFRLTISQESENRWYSRFACVTDGFDSDVLMLVSSQGEVLDANYGP